MRKFGGFSFMKYTKPPLSYEQQVDLLIGRGLIVKDKQHAIQILSQVGYYRLSAYRFPFQQEADKFSKGITFEDLYSLYQFDHDLRGIILEALAIVEVAMRARLIYHLSHSYGAFGYLEKKNFLARFSHQAWLDNIEEETVRSKETFVTHYKKKYVGSTHLPLWMLGEVLSFGAFSKLYSGLHNPDKTIISQDFGVYFPVFGSWMHSFVYVRNVCAHHGRLWNRELAIKPGIPHKVKLWQDPFLIENHRIFGVIAVLTYCLLKVRSEYDLVSHVKTLLDLNPSISKVQMGMTLNWIDHRILK